MLSDLGQFHILNRTKNLILGNSKKFNFSFGFGKESSFNLVLHNWNQNRQFLPTNAGIRTTLVDTYNIFAVFQALLEKIWLLRRKGTDFNFYKDANEKRRPTPKHTILSVFISSTSYGVGIILILIIFGGLCLLAIHRILCDSGSRCSR
jgi:hypothetical protein